MANAGGNYGISAWEEADLGLQGPHKCIRNEKQRKLMLAECNLTKVSTSK